MSTRLSKLHLNHDSAKYAARAWRTDVLRQEAADEVTKMLQAFVPHSFTVEIRECDEAVPGFPYAPRYKFVGTVRDAHRDGSDAHFFCMAYTREGVTAKLLAHIIDGQGFFPMT